MVLVTSKDMEVFGFGRPNLMIRELNVFRCSLAVTFGCEEVADTFLTGFIGQNLIAIVAVGCRASLVTSQAASAVGSASASVKPTGRAPMAARSRKSRLIRSRSKRPKPS